MFLFWLLIFLSDPSGEPERKGKFIVHEWGTFTSFSGSDGVQMDFHSLGGNDLPDFVYDRSRQAGESQAAGYWGKSQMMTRQRMETPVLYFYTDRIRDVLVDVSFNQGLITEFFPPVESMAPRFDPSLVEQHGGVESIPFVSRISWGKVRLFPWVPTARLSRWQGAGVPSVETNSHYGQARATTAALVRFCTEARNYLEKFLFYRGVGNFDQPLRVEALGKGQFVLMPTPMKLHGRELDGQPIELALIVEFKQGVLRFVLAQPGKESVQVELPRESSPLKDLELALEDALVTAGLFVDEARAMIETWRDSWFEEGTRVFYLFPESLTEELLPLRIEPVPGKLVRVMVGRQEILTPEKEARLAKLLRHAGQNRVGVMRHLDREIRQLGRFAKPAIQRAARGLDAEEKKVALDLLATMQGPYQSPVRR